MAVFIPALVAVGASAGTAEFSDYEITLPTRRRRSRSRVDTTPAPAAHLPTKTMAGIDPSGFPDTASEPTTGTASTSPNEVAVGLFTTRAAFARLFADRSPRRAELLQDFARRHDPSLVLSVALSEFSKKGNQDRLDLCARLLSAMGRRALRAIQAIANSGVEEQAAFVDLVASFEQLTPEERLDLLERLAKSSVEDTRWRLLDVVGCLSEDTQNYVLHLLENDDLPEIAERARSVLVELA